MDQQPTSNAGSLSAPGAGRSPRTRPLPRRQCKRPGHPWRSAPSDSGPAGSSRTAASRGTGGPRWPGSLPTHPPPRTRRPPPRPRRAGTARARRTRSPRPPWSARPLSPDQLLDERRQGEPTPKSSRAIAPVVTAALGRAPPARRTGPRTARTCARAPGGLERTGGRRGEQAAHQHRTTAARTATSKAADLRSLSSWQEAVSGARSLRLSGPGVLSAPGVAALAYGLHTDPALRPRPRAIHRWCQHQVCLTV